MNAPGPRLLARHDFDSLELWRRHPPRLIHPKKAIILQAAGGLSREPVGVLGVSRYAAGALPSTFGTHVSAHRSDGSAFDYAAPESGTTEWHVNFADTHLFCAYGAAAFAQDEIQVAEHPILGSCLEALRAQPLPGLPPLTQEAGAPTPMLFRGAERWCAIDTDPDLAMPYGIYGRRFAKASDAALRQAVTPLNTSHRSNLIAMSAPTGSGRYTRAELEFVLATAFTGYAAARTETPSEQRVVVHTGHWGTGAFGGNRVLMALLQLVAARLAHVDLLVYHSLAADGAGAFEEAARLVPQLCQGAPAEALSAVEAMGFLWGASDGN